MNNNYFKVHSHGFSASVFFDDTDLDDIESAYKRASAIRREGGVRHGDGRPNRMFCTWRAILVKGPWSEIAAVGTPDEAYVLRAVS